MSLMEDVCLKLFKVFTFKSNHNPQAMRSLMRKSSNRNKFQTTGKKQHSINSGVSSLLRYECNEVGIR